MNLVFVELRSPIENKDFNNLLSKYAIGDYRFIALTPLAIDKFWKLEENFFISEDYSLWKEDQKYSNWFKAWLEKLDKIATSCHPFFLGLDIPVTIHCLTMLKNVMDSYIRTALQYHRILEIEEPENIFIVTDYKTPSNIKTSQPNPAEARLSSKTNIYTPLDIIDDELYFKFPSVYYRLIKGKFEIGHSYKIYKKSNIENVKNHIRYLKENDIVKKLNGKRVELLKIPTYEYDDRFYPSCPLPLFQDIDQEFDFPPYTSRNILWPRIRHFLVKILPEIEFYAKWYEGYFQKKNFKCLVFNRRNQLYQYGALIAARKIGLKTCYIRHGWDSFSDGKKGCWWRLEQRLRPFDYFVCPNKIDRKYYSNLVKEENLKTKVL